DKDLSAGLNLRLNLERQSKHRPNSGDCPAEHHQMKRVTTSLRRLLLLRQLRILRQELGRIESKAFFFLA
ncbi:unnamed protein product, partial [Dovyalis caffra]